MKVMLEAPKTAARPITTTKQVLIEAYSGIERDYRLKQKKQSLTIQTDNLQGTHFHSNYLECLEQAWGGHYGIVFSPDILWHTLLSEIVKIVAESPADYAHLFTTTPDQKQTIIIRTEEMVVMPLPDLVEALRSVVPTDIDQFIPTFTTTTERSLMARYASFADLVSPYYNYMMLCCGIPFVDVQGTTDDWKRILEAWKKIGVLLNTYKDYFAKVEIILNRLINEKENSSFWQEMFRLVRCGSGSDHEAFGWFMDLFREQPSLRYIKNYSSHIAKVCYKQLNTQKEYEMLVGLFSSELQDDCLVPDFGAMVFNRLKEPLIIEWNPYEFQVTTTLVTAK